jgi:hypothetical protein
MSKQLFLVALALALVALAVGGWTVRGVRSLL